MELDPKGCSVLSVATSLVTLVGMWLVGRKDWRGWLVGLVNQVLWLALIIQTHAWGLLILTVSLVYIYTRALIRWRRDDALLIAMSEATLSKVAGRADAILIGGRFYLPCDSDPATSSANPTAEPRDIGPE